MKRFYLVTHFEEKMSLKTYSHVRKLSAAEKCKSLFARASDARHNHTRVFYSRKDAIVCYQTLSRLFENDFSTAKGYIVMTGLFMEQKVDLGGRFYQSILKQRVSRPLSAKEIKALEAISND